MFALSNKIKIYSKRTSSENVLTKSLMKLTCNECDAFIDKCHYCKNEIKESDDIICMFGWSVFTNMNTHCHKACYEKNYSDRVIVYLKGDENENRKSN